MNSMSKIVAKDTFRCLMGTQFESLTVGNFCQDMSLRERYAKHFEPD